MAEVIAAYPPEVRAILLKVLTNRNQAQRARWIGELYADERARGFAELLIDLEEDPAARAFVVGVLREAGCGRLAACGLPGLRFFQQTVRMIP